MIICNILRNAHWRQEKLNIQEVYFHQRSGKTVWTSVQMHCGINELTWFQSFYGISSNLVQETLFLPRKKLTSSKQMKADVQKVQCWICVGQGQRPYAFSVEHLGPVMMNKNSPVTILRRHQTCWTTLPAGGRQGLKSSLSPICMSH